MKAGPFRIPDWGKKLLHQLENGHNVPLFMPCGIWRNVLGKQQNNRGKKPLCRVIKVRILPAILLVPAGVHNGFGKDLCVFFRFRAGG